MKTSICQFLAYCETSGGPVCIASIQEAEKWLGTESENSLYYDVIAQIGTSIRLPYKNLNFFNTETGNFVLFKNHEELIIAELISVEEQAGIPWGGIEFSVKENSDFNLILDGMTCFFDSSISISHGFPPHESLMDIGDYGTWNYAAINCSFSKGREVFFKNSAIHLEGLSFYN